MRKLIAAATVVAAGLVSQSLALAPLADAAPSAASVHASGQAHSVAAKKKKPKLRLGVSSFQVNAGAPFTIGIDSKKAKKLKVFLQRTQGTAGAYSNVAKVPKKGSAVAPGMPMGKYSIRLVGKRKGKVVATSNAITMYSYGQVTLQQLCDRSDNTYFSGCDSGTVPVGNNVFAYTNYDSWGTGPDDDDAVAIRAQGSSCNAIAVEYAVSNEGADDGVTGLGAALSQETADRQQVAGAVRTTNTAIFSISSGAWNLALWTEGPSAGDYTVRYRGFASCWTSTGDA